MRSIRGRRWLPTLIATTVAVAGTAGPAFACGGVFSQNGEVNLTRTTTLAAYADGVEHYITAFEFAGAGGAFGSIVPLPGVPTSVEEGGEWTLQRLVKEVTPQPRAAFAEGATALAASDSAKVLLETRVGALDLTVLEGGAQAVGRWATDNGFLLSPDAPEVLDFYARRSPIFLAARFDAAAVVDKGVNVGDGTPVHITIPTSNPWVPLRILGLGRVAGERIDADVFVLTEIKPTLLTGRNSAGVDLARQEPASSSLLADLRTDKGMDWLPQSGPIPPSIPRWSIPARSTRARSTRARSTLEPSTPAPSTPARTPARSAPARSPADRSTASCSATTTAARVRPSPSSASG